MRVSKTSPIVTALVLPVLCYALPQTRTLYNVESTELPPISASFVSTNAAGATVWAIVEQVISTTEIDDVSTTFTSDIPPTTLIGTAVEDAHTLIYSYIPENAPGALAVVETCEISGSHGDCTALAWVGTETQTLTIAGTVVPIFTETQAAGTAATITTTTGASGTGIESLKAATNPTGSGTSKGGAATNQIAMMAVIMGVIGCILTL